MRTLPWMMLFIFHLSNTVIANNHSSSVLRDSIPYFDSSHFLVNAGPRNYDSSNYAIVCLYRPATTQGGKYWFAVFANDEEIARINENDRFLVKIPKEGKMTIESRYNNISAIQLNVKFHETYFIKVEGALAANKVTAKLSQISNEQVIEENNKPNWNDYYLDYPWPGDYSHIHMYEKINFEAHYISNMRNPIDFYDAKFLPPSSARFFYYMRNSEPYEIPHFHFVYTNWLLSSTYFKEINLYRDDHKPFDSVDELMNYVKKIIKDGNRLMSSKKDSLMVLRIDVIPGLGDMAVGCYAEIKELRNDTAGISYTAIRKQYVIYIFKRVIGKKKLFPIIGRIHGIVVLISETGLPDEVHSYEEIRDEIHKFCAGVTF